MEKFLEVSSKNKNKIFLFACLTIHTIYAAIFIYMGSYVLANLNVASAAFYIIAIVSAFKYKNAAKMVLVSYFEILIFSILSEWFSGGGLGFILFPFGMVGVIFYLLPREYSVKRYIIQFHGVVTILIMFIIDNSGQVIMPNVKEKLAEISVPLSAYNTIIALGTVVYVSCLYMREIDQTRDKLNYNVHHDALTGLYNRRFFEHTMRRHKDDYTGKYAIVMFDIDDFKKVNDTYGHEAGDHVLEMVSECLRKNMGETDLAVRWGGEEFILFFPDTDVDFAERKTIQIQNDIRRTATDCGDNKIMVTTTAGIASDSNIDNYEDVIRRADERLYYGKRHGKNCHIKEG